MFLYRFLSTILLGMALPLAAQILPDVQQPLIKTPQFEIYIATFGADSHSGDSLEPLATFTAALNKIESRTIGQTGDVYAAVVFYPGTYPFAASQPANKFEVNGRRLNVSVRGMNGAVLVGSGLNQGGGDAMIALKGHNIFVKNISIDYAPANGINFGYRYNGTLIYSHDVLVENVRVKNTAGHGIIGGMGKMNENGSGFLDFSERFLFRKCEVTESVNHNNLEASQWGSAIKFHYVKNGIVENCRVYNNAGEGIDLDYCENIMLKDNTLFDNRANIYLDKAENCILQSNLLYYKQRQSVSLLLSTEAVSALIKDYFLRNIYIYNNTILNSQTAIGYWQGTIGGLQTTSLENLHIAHNSIIGKPLTTGGMINFSYEKGHFGGPPSNINFSNITLENNIISAHPDSLTRPIVFGPIDPQPALSYGYNLWSENPIRAYNSSTDLINANLPNYVSADSINKLIPLVGQTDALIFKVPAKDYLVDDMLDSLRTKPKTNVGAFELQQGTATKMTEHANEDDFKIYPNPVKDFIRLQASQNIGGASYQIVNSTGKLVMDGVISEKEIDIRLLPPGSYVLTFFKDKKARQSARFLKVESID